MCTDLSRYQRKWKKKLFFFFFFLSFLHLETCGGTNLSPDTFCDGMEPELSDTDLPVSITFSVHQHQQYNVTASWQHLSKALLP